MCIFVHACTYVGLHRMAYVYPYLSKNTWDLTKELFFGLVIALLVSFGYFYLINFQF